MDMLRDLLSGPDAGDKISSMLSAFTGDNESENTDESAESSIPLNLGTLLGGDSSISNILSGIGDVPVDGIMKMISAYSQASKQEDPRANLLRAMRPYLQPHRLGSLDQAIKLLGYLKFLPLLGEFKDII